MTWRPIKRKMKTKNFKNNLIKWRKSTTKCRNKWKMSKKVMINLLNRVPNLPTKHKLMKIQKPKS